MWKEIGGFSDYISGCADCSFFFKAWNHGYFRSLCVMDKPIRNLSKEIHNKDSTIGKSGYDASYPKIFKMPDYEQHCKDRTAYSYELLQKGQQEPAGAANMNYWHEYTKNMLGRGGTISTIDWLKAKTHGHDKWKDIINSEKIIKNETFNNKSIS